MENKYKLGLVSVSFRPYSPREILEAMREAGLEYIEWGSDIHAPCAESEKIEEIVALQREYGVKCSSYGTYFKLGRDPVEELYGYINAAKRLGTDVLRVWCGDKSGDKCDEDERARLFADAKAAARMAEREGVLICTECHKNSFTERLCDSLELMSCVDSPNFCTYWQPFQWQSRERNIEYARGISDYARHIHVFNWHGEGRSPLGEAVEEWREYLSCFEGERTLLLEFMPDGRIETLRAEAEALRSIAEVD